MKKPKTHTFESMRAAAGTGRWSMALLKAAKNAGCSAFRGPRVYGDELDVWLREHPEVAKAKDVTWRTKIDKEKHRKLKMENDVRSGELIERSWMAERIHAAAGKVDASRVKSEAEHPLLFAAAEGNVPACREVVQKIWDDILTSMNSLAEDFKEPKK